MLPINFLETAINFGSKFLSNKKIEKENSPEKKSWLARIPLLGSFFDRLTPGQKERAEKIRETAEKERGGIFGEVWESVLARYFPGLSKFLDIKNALGFGKKDVETVPWQNEWEALTAFSLFVPDFLLKIITDHFANSPKFLKILENWPVRGKKFASKIRAKKDPDDVIDALRMMHQDFITGKVSLAKIFN